MKKSFFIPLFILFTIPVFAQSDWSVAVDRFARAASRDNMLNLNQHAEIEGSPYYNQQWKPGYIITKKGIFSNTYQLRYVILTNRLLLAKNGAVYIVSPDVAKGFTLTENGRKVLFKKGFTSSEYGIKADKYLKVIYDGKIKLVVNYKVNQSRSTDWMTGIETIHFDTDKWYYLITSDGVFHEVELEKDDILELLPGDNAKLKEYAESLNLDYSKAKHLQKILSIYEQLNAKKEKGSLNLILFHSTTIRGKSSGMRTSTS